MFSWIACKLLLWSVLSSLSLFKDDGCPTITSVEGTTILDGLFISSVATVINNPNTWSGVEDDNDCVGEVVCGTANEDSNGNCGVNDVNDNEPTNCLCSVALSSPPSTWPLLSVSVCSTTAEDVVALDIFTDCDDDDDDGGGVVVVKFVEVSILNRIFIQIITQQVII